MLKIGQRFYDERNGRYLTITGVGANPKAYDCVQEEMDEENVDELVVTDKVLMNEYELKHFKEV